MRPSRALLGNLKRSSLLRDTLAMKVWMPGFPGKIMHWDRIAAKDFQTTLLPLPEIFQATLAVKGLSASPEKMVYC
jgi:hypothetical protein